MVILTVLVVLRLLATQVNRVQLAALVLTQSGLRVLDRAELNLVELNLLGVPVLTVLGYRPVVGRPSPVSQLERPVVNVILGVRGVLLPVLLNHRFVLWEEGGLGDQRWEVADWVNQGDLN